MPIVEEAGGELQALALTTDHKCDLPGEMERVAAKGGWVRPGRVDRRIAFALCGTEHVERFVRQFYAGAVDDACVLRCGRRSVDAAVSDAYPIRVRPGSGSDADALPAGRAVGVGSPTGFFGVALPVAPDCSLS